MENALLVFSPLDNQSLDVARAINAARAFKAAGIRRADLAFDLNRTSNPHKGRIRPDFTRAARNVADMIFRPVIGRSDLRDLEQAVATVAQPDYANLARVGAIFAGRGNGNASGDGHDIGLVFHTAIHGRTGDGKAYDTLISPILSSRALDALGRLGPVVTLGPAADIYDAPVIDLAMMRQSMHALYAQMERTFGAVIRPSGAVLH